MVDGFEMEMKLNMKKRRSARLLEFDLVLIVGGAAGVVDVLREEMLVIVVACSIRVDFELRATLRDLDL